MTAEHETLIAQADALGLGAREIAERASIAHGTVAAIVRRHAQRTNGGRMVATEAGEDTATTSLSSRQAPPGARRQRGGRKRRDARRGEAGWNLNGGSPAPPGAGPRGLVGWCW